MYEHAWIFVNKFSTIWIIGILYNVSWRKQWFGQASCIDLLKMIQKNFTLYFSEFYTIYY
jgi:hypothetical protein